MKQNLKLNHYQSITLWHHPDGDLTDFGKLYVSVKSAKLDLHADITYRSGKKLMAHLMLITGKMPEVRRYEDFTVYDLHTFID